MTEGNTAAPRRLIAWQTAARRSYERLLQGWAGCGGGCPVARRMRAMNLITGNGSDRYVGQFGKCRKVMIGFRHLRGLDGAAGSPALATLDPAGRIT